MGYYNNKKIRWLLKRKDITINEAAKLCECSIGTMNNILAGEDIKLSTLLKICKYLQIDIVDLFDYTNINIEQKIIEDVEKPDISSLIKDNEHLKEVLFEKERLIQTLQNTINLITKSN